jgi:hypothetical protein
MPRKALLIPSPKPYAASQSPYPSISSTMPHVRHRLCEVLIPPSDVGGRSHELHRLVMGSRRSRPKAFGVIFRPGGA